MEDALGTTAPRTGRSPRHPPGWPPGPVPHPPDDIAEMFEVPKETVYQWRKKRIGPPGFRIGKYVRYDPADVRAYVAERKSADYDAA
ncbi:hypothetical protein GCM10020256_45240 [Streptomyces thermocoprophilus]